MAAREIERLNTILENKNKEIQNLQGQCMEGETAARQLKNLSDQLRKMVDENKDLHNEIRDGQEKLRISNAQTQKLVMELNEYKTHIVGSEQQTDEFKKKIQRLLQENTGLGEELRGAQDALRLSTAQQNKIMTELAQFKEENNRESDTYRLKIQKLLGENTKLGEEVQEAQERVRLSASQIGKLNNELKITCNELEEARRRLSETSEVNKRIPEYESKIALLSQELERLNGVVEKKNSEIRALGGQFEEVQENLRLSTTQQGRMNQELNDIRSKYELNYQESETYKQRIQKLHMENTTLGDEMRTAQENLRLSAGQISKLNNELKSACNEIEGLQKRLVDSSSHNKRIPDLENKVAMLSQEIERLNSVIEKKNN
jgi:chromosome segregation ATPase